MKFHGDRLAANLAVFDIGLRSCRGVKKRGKGFTTPRTLDCYWVIHVGLAACVMRMLPDHLSPRCDAFTWSLTQAFVRMVAAHGFLCHAWVHLAK